MILPILLYGSDVLRDVAQEADLNDKEAIKELISNMWETLKDAEGVGLAAPQVGRPLRIVVVDGTPMSDDLPRLKGFKRTMINPVVVRESEEMVSYDEGCLSIPDVRAMVLRPEKITVSYLDENFEKREEDLDDFACRIVQHELDHLEGVLFVDKVAPIRKKMISNKLYNISKGKVRSYYKTKIEKRG